MNVGLDFGTTNSSASLYDGHAVTLLPLDPSSPNPRVMRTTLFMTREGERYIGRDAIDRFTTANVGRKIEYVWRNFGEYELVNDKGEITKQSIGALVDANQPGRLFQSLKTHLRDIEFTDTNVFGKRYSIEYLIAIVLRQIVDRVEAITHKPVSRMVIGRPVHYSNHPDGDETAIARMTEACHLADIPEFAFLPEPNAAALAYARTATERQKALVFDFGGGTLDVTIIETDGNGGSVVLSNDGVPVGGDIMDRRIMMGKMLPHFGSTATLGPQRLPFPAVIIDHLSEWQSILELSHPKFQRIIEEVMMTSTQPAKVAQLQTLVNQNYALPLYEIVEKTKVALSSQAQADVAMHVPGIDIDQTVERWDFERMIGPDVRTVAACIDRALASASLSPADIHIVLRTGGSSRIPVFVNMLTAKFGSAAMVEMDPFTGVAQGLGIAANDDALFAELQARLHP